MGALSSTEREATERAAAEPMLAQVEAWAAVNSGSTNLDGLRTVAGLLADAFAALPGDVALDEAAAVRAVDQDGTNREITHGRNLHLAVRPQAPVQLLFTGHMDTVFAADHPFQASSWIEPGKVLGGPGVADMKGGIAVMLAALKAVESSPEAGAIG
jgi:glutamate carboxypeptidase